MSKDRCFNYNGQYYDVGTKVKMKIKGEIIETTYLGSGGKYARYQFEGIEHTFNACPNLHHIIIEIVEPVYYQEPPVDESKKENIFFRTGSGSAAHSDDVFHGFLLYLAVMLGGIIFKDRWLIWIMATIVYFGWKKKL